MSTLLVIGAGGHGRVVADAALTMNQWQDICYVDDQGGADVLGFPIVGGLADLKRLSGKCRSAVVAIGNARLRLQLLDECAALGFELPPIIHSSASVSRFAQLGAACVVFAQSAINPGARLGRGCIVNTGATVDHDCELAAGVHVCPGAHLAGDVKVGERSWIGIGSAVKQGIRVGSDVIVGAGAAVVSDIAPCVTVIGVPARVKQTRREQYEHSTFENSGI